MQNQLPQYLKNNAAAMVLAIAAFFAYAVFPLASPKLYNSPDDHANAFFIQHFAQTGTLWYMEPLNAIAHERIVSRSMRAIGERVVPIGFPGLAWLYGMLAWLAGVLSIPPNLIANMITPALVALSAYYLVRALKPAWGNVHATAAGALYVTNPALWYYAARGLYPNAAVIALTIIALSVWCARFSMPSVSEKQTNTNSINRFRLGIAIPLMLALIIRPLEIVWIGPLFAFATLWSWKKNNQHARALIFSTVIATLGAALVCVVLNMWIYGAPFTTGYSASLAAPDALQTVAPTLRATLGRMLRFGFFLFPAHALLATTAVMWLVSQKEYRKYVMVSIVALASFAALFAGFGARDVINDYTPSIGISFTRYWLPVFVAASGCVALALKSIARPAVTVLTLILASALSLHAVWFGSLDSLSPVYQSLTRYQTIKPQILELTPKDAIIIVEQADKILFPDRRVVAWLRNPGTIQDIPVLLQHAPVYYFGLTLSPSELTWLKAERFPDNLRINPVQNFAHETLYQFSYEDTSK